MAHELGLAGQLDVVHHETSPTQRNAEVFAANPLGKVPVLILDDGFALFDSSVICDYLDTLHGGRRLIPAAGKERLLALRLQAIAQGICEAGIAVRHDTVRRPAQYRYPAMREGQTAKLIEAYAFLDREELPRLGPNSSLDIGRIALATALDWIEFRGLPGFRERVSGLGALA